MTYMYSFKPSSPETAQPIHDKESHRPRSWFRQLFLSQIDESVYDQAYPGDGTKESPFVIEFLHNDRQDAMNFSKGRKWAIAILLSLSTLAVTFASSAYSSALEGISEDFNVSHEIAIIGLSLFVLGWSLGPLVWAPLSEVYGRKLVFIISYTAYVAFSIGAACAPNIAALIIFRLLASSFGSSSLTNTGGVVADLFSKNERGLATGLFATAPFLGPALGPVVGGFLAHAAGWRWVLGLVTILGGVSWIATILVLRETYAPYILRSRAEALSRMTGSTYISRLDAGKPAKSLSQELKVSFTRPWQLLFREPIVLLTSIYIAVVYGTLYMFFPGIAIVFEGTRGWSKGIAGLPFIGVAIGVVLATVASGVDNKRYVRLCKVAETDGIAVEPEGRLSTAMAGSIVLPIGLFLFAWTTYPEVHWIVPVIGITLFSCGMVMVFISLLSYLIDSYVIYAASVLAANSVLRSLFATAFPLFTSQMYKGLGDQWASSIPAFIVLGCVPFPFLFYKYGPQIRSRCKYASEAAKMLEAMQRRHMSKPRVQMAGQEELAKV